MVCCFLSILQYIYLLTLFPLPICFFNYYQVERIGDQQQQQADTNTTNNSDPEALGLFQSLESVGDSRAVNSWDPSFVTTVVGVLQSHPVGFTCIALHWSVPGGTVFSTLYLKI